MRARRSVLLNSLILLASGAACHGHAAVKPRHKPAIKLLDLTPPTAENKPEPEIQPEKKEAMLTAQGIGSAWHHMPRHVVIPSAEQQQEETVAQPPLTQAQQTAQQRPVSQPSSHMPQFQVPSEQEMENIFASLRDVFNFDDDDFDDDDGGY